MLGIVSTLSVASTFEGGLSNFFKNTAHPYALLAGSGSSLISSILVNIVVSLATHKIKTPEDEAIEWKKLRDIDNPLSPWAELFREDFPGLGPKEQPSKQQFDKLFKKAKIVAVVGGTFIIILFIVIIPSVMSSLHVLSFDQFLVWTKSLHVWCFIMAIVVIIFAPIEEVMQIGKQITLNKSRRPKHSKDDKATEALVEITKKQKQQDIVSELKEKQVNKEETV